MSRGGLLAAMCGFTALLGATPASAVSTAALRTSLDRDARILGSYSGAYVQDLDTGQVVFARRPDRSLAPASNEKLLVTSAALLRLGPTSTMKTLLVAPGAPADGVVPGSVALVGGGDPYLSSAELRSLARQIADEGVTKIDGRVLADASLLDGRVGSFASGWGFDPNLGGRLAALVVDRGRGVNPPLNAATTLHRALRSEHIKLAGLPRAGRLPRPNTEIGRLTSAPLSTVIGDINGPSDNFAAELLLKDVGAFAGGGGTTFAGAAVVNSTLSRLGIHATIYDGSGLSRADHVTPRTIERLLATMATRPEGAALAASLPVAGRSGTLAHRMRHSAARGRCRAKTGTLIGVSALSGYCTSTTGARVAFSFIENRVCAYCAKRIEDRMTTTLARYDPSAPSS